MDKLVNRSKLILSYSIEDRLLRERMIKSSTRRANEVNYNRLPENANILGRIIDVKA